MTWDIVAIAALALAWLSECVRSTLAERAWRAERRELCGRIQAGTLRDYATNVPRLHPRPSQKVELAVGADGGTESGFVVPALPEEVDVGQARQDFDKLMET